MVEAKNIGEQLAIEEARKLEKAAQQIREEAVRGSSNPEAAKVVLKMNEVKVAVDQGKLPSLGTAISVAAGIGELQEKKIIPSEAEIAEEARRRLGIKKQ